MSLIDQINTDAWQQGYAAFHADPMVFGCNQDYAVDSPEFDAWNCGWEFAELEDRGGDDVPDDPDAQA